MLTPLINFLKNTYPIIIVTVVIVAFFVGYNTYMVDRSLNNLRFALNRIDKIKTLDDAKKIAAVLDVSLLMEVSAKELPAASIAKLELVKELLQDRPQLERDANQLAAALYYSLIKEATRQEVKESSLPMIELSKDILIQPRHLSQIEDAKFALREVITQKESARPPILAALDKINQMFVQRVTKLVWAKLEKQARSIEKQLKQLKEVAKIAEAYYELGNIYTQLSEFERAKENYKKVTEFTPGSQLAYKSQFNIAWNEKLKGNLDQAIQEFEVVSKMATEEELDIFSQYQIADILRKKGEYEEAIEIYKKVAARETTIDLGRIADYLIGYTYLYDLQNYEKAKEVFDESREAFKGSSIGEYIEQKALPSVASQYHLQGFRLLSEGYRLSYTEKFQEAIVYFDKALGINPNDGIAYAGKALALLWLKDSDNALSLARKAVQLMPNNEIASVNLGYIYIQLSLFDDAIAEYKRFIAINPFNALSYYNLGCAYAIQRKYEQAVSAFYDSAKIDPTFVSALNNQGWCLWQLDRQAEAINLFERVVQIDKKFLDGLFNLGMVYKATGRFEEAKKRFEDLIKLNPSMYQEIEKHLRELNEVLQWKKKSE